MAVEPAPHGIRQSYRCARNIHLIQLKSVRVPVGACWNRLLSSPGSNALRAAQRVTKGHEQLSCQRREFAFWPGVVLLRDQKFVGAVLQ